MPTPLEVAILEAMAKETDDYLYFHSLKLLAAQRGYILVSMRNQSDPSPLKE